MLSIWHLNTHRYDMSVAVTIPWIEDAYSRFACQQQRVFSSVGK